MVRSGYDVILAKGLPGNAGRRVAVALSLALALAIVLVVAAPLLVAS
jgi:hypothetical protein